MKTMEAVVACIVRHAIEKVCDFGYDDQYQMLEEAARRLQEEAENALKTEYLISEVNDYEQ